ncbi:MAG: xanthine dehydrogenase family protein molybdopterin-binding subunit [Chloroflexota bacterium]
MGDTSVGRWVRREDGEAKVTGIAAYTGDLSLPGMLYAWLVLSPYAHARITSIDTDEARNLPGVAGVYTADDLPLVTPEDLTRTRDPLARDRTYFEGQPVVAVVAATPEIAEDAAGLVVVEYEPREVAVDVEKTLGDTREMVHDSATLGMREDAGAHTDVSAHTQQLPRPANATSAQRYQRGDVETALQQADAVVERTYHTSWVYQAYLEPQSSAAVPDGTGGLTVYTSTQGSFFVRSDVAKALDIPSHKVKVVPMEVGGAFGAKYALLDPLVAGLAWKLGRPVSLVLSRQDDFQAGTPAPGTVMHVKTGAKRDGTLTALQATVIVDSGSFPGETSGVVSLLLGGTYRFPNLRIDAYEVLTNKPGAGAYRAPGAPQACFAMEGQMDELAAQLGIDPLELRLRNAVVEGDLMPGEAPWPRVGAREVLRTLGEQPAWENRHRKEPGEGVGIALGGWPAGTQPAAATCRLNDDGSLSIVVGSVDISGTKTGLALLAAEGFGTSGDAVQVITADTDAAPFAGASGGSKITYTVGKAVHQAAEDARKQVLAIAADHLEVAAEDLDIVGDEVQVRGAPDRGVSLKQIAQLSTSFGGKYEPVLGQGRSALANSAPSFVAHLARVHVDDETGKVRVQEYTAVQDVGKSINPGGIQDQVHGGIAQGVGWALLEGMVYDQEGHLRTSTFADYALPSSSDMPDVESVLVEVPSEGGPLGARGVGEPPVVAGAAAIASAIFDATGVRPTDLPMTSEALLAAMREKKEPAATPTT